MRRRVKRLLEWTLGLSLFLLPVGWLVYAEVVYSRRINPEKIANAREHLLLFDKNLQVYELQVDGRTFYEFHGFPPEGVPFPALPSGPPSYIYDSHGKRVDWCGDPDDARAFRAKWPRKSVESVPLGELPESLLK